MSPQDSSTLSQYLARFSQSLVSLPHAEREDILRELQSHFDDALKAGQAPATIVERMGPPDRVAEAMAQERLVLVDRQRSAREIARLILRAALGPFLWGMLALLSVCIVNLLYVYANLLTQMHATGYQVLRLVIFNLPACLIIGLPLGILFTGIVGLPAIARTFSPSLYRRLQLPVSLAILATGLLASLVSFVFNDQVVTRANREVVKLVRLELQHQSWTEEALSPQELTSTALRARLDQMRAAANPASVSPSILDEHTNRLMREATQYHLKFSLPFSCLAMALLGLALGSAAARWSQHRMASRIALGTGVGLVFAAYLSMSWGLHVAPALGHPALAAWLPNLFLIVASLFVGTASMVRRSHA